MLVRARFESREEWVRVPELPAAGFCSAHFTHAV